MEGKSKKVEKHDCGPMADIILNMMLYISLVHFVSYRLFSWLLAYLISPHLCQETDDCAHS